MVRYINSTAKVSRQFDTIVTVASEVIWPLGTC